MKLDFVCEFDLKYCYEESCNKNWIIKKKPEISPIDGFIISDLAWEKKQVKFEGYGIKAELSKQYFQQMKITAKNADDFDLYWYGSYCLIEFNRQFKKQKEVDIYFGRRS